MISVTWLPLLLLIALVFLVAVALFWASQVPGLLKSLWKVMRGGP